MLGGVLWSLVALYVSLVLLSGFGSWDAPNVYVTAIMVFAGLAVNAFLFRGARTPRALSTLALLIVSLSLSAAVVGSFAYVALDPRQP
jgi:hypothetical protein